MKFGINNPAWLQSAGNTVVAAEPLTFKKLIGPQLILKASVAMKLNVADG